MIQEAKAEGTRYRLVCSAERLGDDRGSVDARVELRRVKLESPFAALQGASSAVVFVTDVLGPVTLTSTDPTTKDTAYGLLSDSLIALSDAQ
mmetsp:Transcript_36286/g.54160  ORF Transcript_36286/g.54160 Transcript_36286/m.54160 type:complete len:92 (+) Transcript_36286:147-422(+)